MNCNSTDRVRRHFNVENLAARAGFKRALVLAEFGFVLAIASAALGQDAIGPAADPPAGHSNHGEAFNEGPRQQARLLADIGPAHMEVTCKLPLAQQFFDQGLNLLHGFWYFEAERAFRQTLAIDPDCAMAFWGMAMSNRDNRPRARGLIADALRRREGANPRERAWIDALARFLGVDPEKPVPAAPAQKVVAVSAANTFSVFTVTSDTVKPPADTTAAAPPKPPVTDGEKEKPTKEQWQRLIRDLEDRILDDRNDLEPKAFLAWAMWEASREGVPLVAHEPVDALLAQVLASSPRHHGAHHYVIHLWDQRQARRALASAALCGPSAPAIAHCWHMSGHIYAQLHRHADAAWQQEASGRVDHAYMSRDRIAPYLIHNYAHNQEWWARSLLNLGRSREAVAAAENLIAIGRHPRHNALTKEGTCAQYGRRRLIEALLESERWTDLAGYEHSPLFDSADAPLPDAQRHWALGLAAAVLGDRQRVDAHLTGIAAALAAHDSASDASEAEQVRDDATRQAEEKTKRQDERKRARQDERKPFTQMETELRMEMAIADGKLEEARALVSQIDPGAKLRRARAHARIGQLAEAVKLAAEAVKDRPNQVLPLATQIELLEQNKEREAALAAFESLRTVAAVADADLPVLLRLQDLAKASGAGEAWRLPEPSAEDLGPRPGIESLGPRTWDPYMAAEFSLADAEGRVGHLQDFAGQSVVLIFYLGVRCLHCVEQLEAFAPKASEFEAAGIRLVGISSESADDLRLAHQRFRKTDGSDFPFVLLSDPVGEAFRAYRAWDDFEGRPLHGLFLVDSKGRVRWQDISFEPFADAGFFLGECRRLLAIEPSATAAVADTSPTGR